MKTSVCVCVCISELVCVSECISECVCVCVHTHVFVIMCICVFVHLYLCSTHAWLCCVPPFSHRGFAPVGSPVYSAEGSHLHCRHLGHQGPKPPASIQLHLRSSHLIEREREREREGEK